MEAVDCLSVDSPSSALLPHKPDRASPTGLHVPAFLRAREGLPRAGQHLVNLMQPRSDGDPAGSGPQVADGPGAGGVGPPRNRKFRM
jgi:hypothetical protein